MNKKTIEDFGEHIGGARKELYAKVRLGDLSGLTDAEKEAFVKKKNIWETPDYEAIKNAKDVKVAYLVNLIYRAIPTSVTRDYDSYISYVQKLKRVAEKLEKVDEYSLCNLMAEENLIAFNKESQYGVKIWRLTDDPASLFIDKKMRKVIRTSPRMIEWQIKDKQFLMSPQEIAETKFDIVYGENLSKKYDNQYDRWQIELKTPRGIWAIYPHNGSEVQDDSFVVFDTTIHTIEICKSLEEAEKTKQKKIDEYINMFYGNKVDKTKGTRKKKFVPKYLSEVVRKGEKFRSKKATGNSYLKTFKFRGGEFGNWLSQSERQTALDCGYDAFCDLAKALGINFDSISLGGKLAIAFGARGHGSAVAHYEPLRNVINLTKKKGAGALAHEWGHALDAYIAHCYCPRAKYASEAKYGGYLKEMKDITDQMNYVEGVKTEYLTKSLEMDKTYSKASHGYWHSDVEMFARLFAAYVHDKLKEMGVRSDYLTGLAEGSGPIPNIEEKKRLYPLVDKLIEKLKEDKNLKREF